MRTVVMLYAYRFFSKKVDIPVLVSQYSLRPKLFIIFTFLYMNFTMHLEIIYIQMHRKNYAPRKAKMTNNWERGSSMQIYCQIGSLAPDSFLVRYSIYSLTRCQFVAHSLRFSCKTLHDNALINHYFINIFIYVIKNILISKYFNANIETSTQIHRKYVLKSINIIFVDQRFILTKQDKPFDWRSNHIQLQSRLQLLVE